MNLIKTYCKLKEKLINIRTVALVVFSNQVQFRKNRSNRWIVWIATEKSIHLSMKTWKLTKEHSARFRLGPGAEYFMTYHTILKISRIFQNFIDQLSGSYYMFWILSVNCCGNFCRLFSYNHFTLFSLNRQQNKFQPNEKFIHFNTMCFGYTRASIRNLQLKVNVSGESDTNLS